MGFLRAEVVTRVPSRERFAELAAAWFTETREELFPELDRGLAAGPSLKFDHAEDPETPMGPLGGAYGTLWVRRQPAPVGGSRARYSDRAWQRMLDGLVTACPYHAELIMEGLDDRGLPARRSPDPVIGVHRNQAHPEWVMLRVKAALYDRDASRHTTDIRFPAHVPRQWAEFARKWVTRAEAAYAHVTDDPEVMGGTALEDATRQNPEVTVPRCPEVLRGLFVGDRHAYRLLRMRVTSGKHVGLPRPVDGLVPSLLRNRWPHGPVDDAARRAHVTTMTLTPTAS